MGIKSAFPFTDWTVGHDGRSNNSAKFLSACQAVDRLIQNSGSDIVHGRTSAVARLIVAQLAHVHGMAPTVRDASDTTKRAGLRVGKRVGRKAKPVRT